jgi:hypothetical protein
MGRIRAQLPTGFLLLALIASRTIAQDNWPQFRGPNSSGVSSNAGLPTVWSASQNVRWKVPLSGVAWSSPVIWGDRVFVTTAVPEVPQESPKKGLYFGGDRPAPRNANYRWELLCLDSADGAIVWRRSVRQAKPTSSIHIKNSYASETPVTDGERIYAYFGAAGLYCFDFNGNQTWPPPRFLANDCSCAEWITCTALKNEAKQKTEDLTPRNELPEALRCLQ